MTTTRELYKYMCPNIECGIEDLTFNDEELLLACCPVCNTALFDKGITIEDIDDDSDDDSETEEYIRPDEDQHYIDTWNKDMDNFHRQAYGEPTPEEGGIRDYSYDNIQYNDAGEPKGYC